MRYTKTALHLVFAVLAAAFFTACASWQTDGKEAGPVSYSGGHGGHH